MVHNEVAPILHTFQFGPQGVYTSAISCMLYVPTIGVATVMAVDFCIKGLAPCPYKNLWLVLALPIP